MIIRVCFDTFHLKVYQQWKSVVGDFQNQASFSKKGLWITFMMCFQLWHYLTSIKTKIIWKHKMKKKTYISFKIFVLWYYTNVVIKLSKPNGHSILKFRRFKNWLIFLDSVFNLSVRLPAWERFQLENNLKNGKRKSYSRTFIE